MTCSFLPTVTVIVTLTACASLAAAQMPPVGVQWPWKNIAGQMFSIDKQDTLRCDLAQMAAKPKRPADCELEWGDAFEVASRGVNAARICHGDTVMDPALPVLGYGDIWQRNGFTCTSEPSGITCFNADRHGFSLSKARQELF